MALVSFRNSGPAASQELSERILQFAEHTIRLLQEPDAGLRTRLDEDNWRICESEVSGEREAKQRCDGKELMNVGKVVWQSGFLLADYLMRKPPLGSWAGVKVLDLGAGTGVVGIALAKAGALVTLTDLPHITPLTSKNVLHNGLSNTHCAVVDLEWGKAVGALGEGLDVITGADLVYEAASHAPLVTSLQLLAAPHTLVFLSFRTRGEADWEVVRLLEGGGFHVTEVPSRMFHEEFGDQRAHAMGPQQGAAGCYHIVMAQLSP